MKKILIISNIILFCLISVSVVFNLIYQIEWLNWIAGLFLILMSACNSFYLFKKNKTNIWFIVFIELAIILAFVGNLFVVNNTLLGFILFSFSHILLFLSFTTISKFEWIELIYGACIAIPFIFLVVFSNIFGFANIWIKLLIILYFILCSIVLGKVVSNLLKKIKSTQIIQVISFILILIHNFLVICYSFSQVSHYILYVITGLFYLSFGLLTSSILTINESQPKNEENQQQEDKNFKITKPKKNIWSMLAIFIVMLLVGYSTVISFENFNIANPKISKTQFLQMVEQNLNIPIVEIYTENNETPKSKEEYVNASFKIYNCENEEYNFSVDMAENYGDENSVGIRLRGNSTKNARKKPFRIKFDKKKSVLGFEKNKSWVLLADYFDQSYIRNYTAFSIASYFNNLDFTPHPNHVALLLNGNFQGLYLLCEQIDEKSGRTNVDEDFNVETDTNFPFLVEMDDRANLEGITGIDNFYVEDFEPVEIKYPESDERDLKNGDDVVYNYINEYINAVFTTIKTGVKISVSFKNQLVGLEDLVNIDSLVDYYLVNEIMHNSDSIYKSIYMHKTKDGLMNFGPVWDFDYSLADNFIVPYEESYIESANNLFIAKRSAIFKLLLQNETFYNKVTNRFNELKYSILNIAENLKNYKEKIDIVASLDTKMWHGNTGKFQYDMQYDYVRLYLLDRYSYLNETFNLSHSDFISSVYV